MAVESGLIRGKYNVPERVNKHERGKGFGQLKKELPAIAKIVTSFPESLQGRVFEVLVGELLGETPVPAGASTP